MQTTLSASFRLGRRSTKALVGFTAALFLGCLCVTIIGVAYVARPAMAAGAQERSGQQIYAQMCARCHGPEGEGTKENYPNPLIGNRAMPALTKYIAKSMPEDDPGKMTEKDSEKVAQYIFDAFYSPSAQAKSKKSHIELAHLTVRQFSNALADLIASFQGGQGTWDDKRGLKGAYTKGAAPRGADPTSFKNKGGPPDVVRLDPSVDFNFGILPPDPEKMKGADTYNINWEGSVFAPETGEYEFIVRTNHLMKLFVNEQKHAFIDGYVRSEGQNVYNARVYLLGGRAYPIKLLFSKILPRKANNGLSPEELEKAKKIPTWIGLDWKRPERQQEVIPDRNLTPNRFPEGFILRTQFPADDLSAGFERTGAASKAWVQAATEAGIETMDYVVDHLQELTDGKQSTDDLKNFCYTFAERAFRRPLTEQQKKVYVDQKFEVTADKEEALKRCILFILTSPRFQYREIGSHHDQYDVASRLSFGLWDSLPDRELLSAAEHGELATREQVRAQAERMMSDVRARAKLQEFFLRWSRVETIKDLIRDAKVYPGFDQQAVSDLRTSYELFLDEVVWQQSDFRKLLTADFVYLNGRLAKFYGVDLPADAPFQKVTMKGGDRAGVLTQPYLLATFAYTSDSSPIHRGVFLLRHVLGVALQPPPDAFVPLAPELHPNLNTRERTALQTMDKTCQACHGRINPLGYALENFDAIGRYRAKEKDRPIDATGSYKTKNGDLATFNGPRELAAFLTNSEETSEALVIQMFQYLVKQPIGAFGTQKTVNLQRSFSDNHFNIRKLMSEIVVESALAAREDKSGAASKSK
jgi:mono/diheme cytochrome c family protein